MENQILEYSTAGRILSRDVKFNVFYSDRDIFGNPDNRYRIIFIESGNLIVELNKIKRTLITPGLILLNEKDHITASESVNLTAHAFYFNPKIINNELTIENINDPAKKDAFSITTKQDLFYFKVFYNNPQDNKIIQALPFETSKMIKTVFLNIKKDTIEQDETCWTCSIRCHLISLLHFIRNISDNNQKIVLSSLPDDRIIDKIILYLNENFNKKVTLSDCVKKFNTNRTSINNLFKSNMKKTIMAYLIELRIKMAASMLHGTHLKINEIMYRVGFNDSGYFNKIFKKINGCTPLEYRKKYCWIKN